MKKSVGVIIICALVLSCAFLEHTSARKIGYPYVPLITEISPYPKDKATAWVEFHNPLDTPVKLSKLMIVVNDRFKYAFPKDLPPIPPSGYIILKLDGNAHSDESRFERGLLTLHTPWDLSASMRGKPGQIAVYRKRTEKDLAELKDSDLKLVGFVAWGAPGSKKSQTGERDRIWKSNWFVESAHGTGDFDPGSLKKADYTIGLYPGSKTTDLTDWVIYSREEASPGKKNPVPRPAFFLPHDGAVVEKKKLAIVWSPYKNAKYYFFQFAKDEKFESLIDERRLEMPVYRAADNIEAGTYYYRVKTIDIIGIESAYSRIRSITAKFWERFAGSIEPMPSEKVLKLKHVHQRKDTRLLCLDGCNSEQHGNPQMPWDGSQPAPTPLDIFSQHLNHGLGNCVRSSISMMVSGYGKSLSQDRIAYFTEEERTGQGDEKPEGDLAHFEGMNFNSNDGGESTPALEWALDTTVAYRENTFSPGPPETGTPTFSEIKQWIFQNRPIMARMPFFGMPFGHVFVINGYGVDPGGDNALHILDPLLLNIQPVGGWQSYDNMIPLISGIWVGPASAPNARQDESSIWKDTDGDGIMDFDEQKRFHTDFKAQDTDGDGFTDKDEIRKYMFDSFGNYNPSNPDPDGDGKRRELDPDE